MLFTIIVCGKNKMWHWFVFWSFLDCWLDNMNIIMLLDLLLKFIHFDIIITEISLISAYNRNKCFENKPFTFVSLRSVDDPWSIKL